MLSKIGEINISVPMSQFTHKSALELPKREEGWGASLLGKGLGKHKPFINKARESSLIPEGFLTTQFLHKL